MIFRILHSNDLSKYYYYFALSRLLSIFLPILDSKYSEGGFTTMYTNIQNSYVGMVIWYTYFFKESSIGIEVFG